MVSAKMFIIRNATIEDFKRLENYSKPVDSIPQFEVELKDTVEDFQDNGNEIYFDFQSDFKSEKEVRGKTIPHVFSYRAKIWCLFEDDKGYLLIFGSNDAAKYISGKLQRIVSDLKKKAKKESSDDVRIEKLKLDTTTLLRIVQEDFIKINNSWWKKIGEDLRSAFLSGRLKVKDSDDEFDENDIYKEIEESAEEITSVTFLSESLGHEVVISRKQASIGSNRSEVTEQDIIGYFKRHIKHHL